MGRMTESHKRSTVIVSQLRFEKSENAIFCHYLINSSFMHQICNGKEVAVKENTYYPYSSGTLVPLDDG
jgi:hypothetical protein